VTRNGSLSYCANRYIIKKIECREIIILRHRKKLTKPVPIILCSREIREKAYSQKKKIMGNTCKYWILKVDDIPKSWNKYHRDDLILNLKKKSNLCIRKIADILGINRGRVSEIKV